MFRRRSSRLTFRPATDRLALTLSSGVLGVLSSKEKSVVVPPLFALGTCSHCMDTTFYPHIVRI